MRFPLSFMAIAMVGIACSDTATVGGRVAYKGKPVLSGAIIALNEDGSASSGVIQPDGRYSVERVKMGQVRFGVISPDPLQARSILKKESDSERPSFVKGKQPKTKPGEGGWFPIPPQVQNPASSGQVIEVKQRHVEQDLNFN